MEEVRIKTRVVGVDVGVSITTLAVVDVRGNVIARDTMPTSDYPDVNIYVTALSEKIVMLAEENGGFENIRAVGMSAPSANFKTGCIENASNIPWKGIVPLAAMLRDRLGLAVALANDAHVTALGERTYGAAHGMSSFIVVSMSHGGVGSCFFTNGEAHLGNEGFAGEVGHVCVDMDGRPCGCGRRGCLETYTSAMGIIQTARELLASSETPSVMRTVQELSMPAILDACNRDDELAIETLRRVGFRMGMGMAIYASVLDPEAIIFTGEQSRLGKWFEDALCASFDEHVFHNIKGKVKILWSELDDKERDVLGASVLAWEVREYSLFK